MNLNLSNFTTFIQLWWVLQYPTKTVEISKYNISSKNSLRKLQKLTFFSFSKNISIKKLKNLQKITFINKLFAWKSKSNLTPHLLKWLNNFVYFMKSTWDLTKNMKLNFFHLLIKLSIDTVYLMRKYFKLLSFFIWMNFIKISKQKLLICLIKSMNFGKIWLITKLKEANWIHFLMD